jgi:tetratricopeptide (TPR) repeat protein
VTLLFFEISLPSKPGLGYAQVFPVNGLSVRTRGLVLLEQVMFRYRLIFCLVAALGPSALQSRQSDIDAQLNRSEELYYEAKFKESVDLLTALEKSIQSRPADLPQKVRLKLQLALGYFALDDVKGARSRFAEMCALDPKCSIDLEKYPPKVVSLFDEVKGGQKDNRCRTVCDSINSQLATGKIEAAVQQLSTDEDRRCECVVEALRTAAEQSFRDGNEAFTKDQFAIAARHFHDALRLNPDYALPVQYLSLIQAKLRLAADQKLSEWRQNFQARDFSQAAARYRELVSLNVEGAADAALGQIRAEYRKAVTASKQEWDTVCRSGNRVGMDRVQRDAGLMLPDPAIAQDLMDQMGTGTCSPKLCVRMDVEKAMLRLKSGNQPVIPSGLQRVLDNARARTVRVEARIEENGDVAVLSVVGESTAINNVVRGTVEKWKFSPAIIENESRCVETAFPIVITPRPK